MKNIALIVVISTFIQGCTSITQPIASRPLVESKFVTPTASVDSSLNSALSNAKTGVSLLVNQQPVVMGDRFFAASGLTCRKLFLEPLGKQIYCLNIQGNWFKVKRVISEYKEIIMPEGSL